MSLTSLEEKSLHAVLMMKGFIDMVENKDVQEMNIAEMRRVVNECEMEANARCEHWRERIGYLGMRSL